MFKNIDHLVITVKDPDASREFYRSLGFEVIDTGSRLEFHAGSFKINAHILGKNLNRKQKMLLSEAPISALGWIYLCLTS